MLAIGPAKQELAFDVSAKKKVSDKLLTASSRRFVIVRSSPRMALISKAVPFAPHTVITKISFADLFAQFSVAKPFISSVLAPAFGDVPDVLALWV